jgi:ubiquinone biosynthesis monooxygenase Coq7
MLSDEAEHAIKAIEAGGMIFSGPVKTVMTAMSKVMTTTTYRI